MKKKFIGLHKTILSITTVFNIDNETKSTYIMIIRNQGIKCVLK